MTLPTADCYSALSCITDDISLLLVVPAEPVSYGFPIGQQLALVSCQL